MRILLADDHPMIRTALEALLQGSAFELAGTASTGAEALSAIEKIDPDLVLLDVQMPDGSGIDVLRRLRKARDKRRVVLLTAGLDDSALLGALAMKVDGIVLKNSDPAFLLECLETVRSGERWIDPDLAQRADALAASRGGKQSLTPRERELIALVAEGLRNREIAERLGVTEGTVKVYLHGLFDRIGVGNRTELALRAEALLGRS